MNVESNIALIRTIFGNPIIRPIIKFLSTHEYNGRSLLNYALTIYSGEEEAKKVKLIISSLIVSQIINLGLKILDVKEEEVRRMFKNRSLRRGLEVILRSISKYGITLPQKLDAPFLVVWNFTNMCNLNCKHCYQNAKTVLKNELTLEEKINVLKQFEEAGVAAIAFSGGEPLIHPHFFKIAEEAVRRGFYTAIATNGTIITDEIARKIKNIGINYVEISLDSIDPVKHDNFRGVRGAWEKTINGILNCVKNDIFTGIAVTTLKMNYKECRKIIEFAKNIGVKRVIFFNFIPVGRGEEILIEDLNPWEREEFLSTLYEAMRDYGIEVLSTAPQYARIVIQKSHGICISPLHFYAGPPVGGLNYLAEFIGGCGAGRLYCALEPNGDVTPCVFIPNIVLGNIRNKKFKEIWNNTPILLAFQNKDILKDNCGKCGFRYICGGCRARAYVYFKDITAPDPGCINNIEFYEKVLCELKHKTELDQNQFNLITGALPIKPKSTISP
ncbi:MAG: radical SAM protein [Candidatus Methanomethylicia archaeon]